MEAFSIVGKIALEGGKKTESSLDKVGQKLKDVGQGFKDFGGKMTTAVSLPIAGLGGLALASATQFDSAQTQIQNQLGLTAEEAEKLNGVAKEVWADGFGESMDEVARNVASVQQHIEGLSDDEIKNLTKGASTLSKTFGIDTNEAIVAVDSLMKDFGMSSTEAMDYLTAGFQNGLDYSGEFTDTLREYGGYFAEMGFSSDEFFSTMVAGAEGGAFQLDKVGDSMKEFTLRAKDGSDMTNDAFSALGLNAEEMGKAFNAGGETAQEAFTKVVTQLQGIEDETVRNQVATDLFGTQYEDLGEEAFTAMLDMTNGLENVEGATERATQNIEESFGTRWTQTVREAQQSLEPLGEILIELAQQILPPLREALEKVANWFKELDDGQKNLVIGVGLFLLALGPLIMFIGGIISVAGTFIGIISKIRNAMALMNLAMLPISGTVLIIIGAILLLIAIGALLYIYWDEIKAWFINLWNVLKEKVMTALTAIKDFFVNAWNTIKNKTIEIYTAVKNYMIQKITEARERLVAILTGIKDFFVNIFTTVKNWVVDTFNKIKNGMIQKQTEAKNKLIGIINAIKNFFIEKFNNIKTNVTKIFNKVKDAIVTPIQKARDLIKTAIDKIKGFFSGLASKLKIKIPKPKLPRFSISGKFSLNPLSVPKLGIKWNAEGGILDTASLIGIGAGEAGEELIMPLTGKNMRGLAETIAGEMPQAPANATETILQSITVPVILNGREIARATAGEMDRELERVRRKRATFKGMSTT